MIGFRRRACRSAEWLPLDDLRILMGDLLGNVVVFGERMGKDKAKAQ